MSLCVQLRELSDTDNKLCDQSKSYLEQVRNHDRMMDNCPVRMRSCEKNLRGAGNTCDDNDSF